jgi:hypothetical protein
VTVLNPTPGTLQPESVTTAAIAANAVTQAKIAAPLEVLIIASGWIAVELGPKIETGGLQVPGVRREGSNARLRGSVKVKAAEELKAGETLFTIKNIAGERPIAAIEISTNSSAGAACKLLISAEGVATVSIALVAAVSMALDSLTFNNA